MLYIRLDGEITCHKQLDIRKNVHWLSKKKKKNSVNNLCVYYARLYGLKITRHVFVPNLVGINAALLIHTLMTRIMRFNYLARTFMTTLLYYITCCANHCKTL